MRAKHNLARVSKVFTCYCDIPMLVLLGVIIYLKYIGVITGSLFSAIENSWRVLLYYYTVTNNKLGMHAIAREVLKAVFSYMVVLQSRS